MGSFTDSIFKSLSTGQAKRMGSPTNSLNAIFNQPGDQPLTSTGERIGPMTGATERGEYDNLHGEHDVAQWLTMHLPHQLDAQGKPLSTAVRSDAFQMLSLKGQMEQALNQLGSSLISRDKACKLLAFAYVLGGGMEDLVLNHNLNSDVRLAQRRLNIFGGEIPHGEYLEELNERIWECEFEEKDTPWVEPLLHNYGLTLTRQQVKAAAKGKSKK